MIAFACVFLVKVATKHSAQLLLDQQEIRLLIERLSDQLSATQVGRGHVIHRMAGGLRKMAESLGSRSFLRPAPAEADHLEAEAQIMDYASVRTAVPTPIDSTSFDQFSAMDGTDTGFSDATFGFGMPFFDFEGTNLDMSSPTFSFPA